MKFWSFFVKKRSFSYLVLFTLLALGFLALSSIPRESSPEVQVPVAIVTTAFPGASAFDVERLITNKVEDQLNNLEGLNNLTSTSREGVSSVVVEFNADADLKESIQKVKDEVDKVKPDLPEDGDEPFVSEVNFVDQPILQISVSTDLPLPEFIALTEELDTEISSIRGVSRVETSGIPQREVQVVVRKEALAQYGITLSEVTQAIGGANLSFPVGSIEVNGVTYAVQFDGNIEDPQEIENISMLNRSGQTIYVRDIALVSVGVSEARSFSRVSVEGAPSEQAATLYIYKRAGGGDITTVNDAVLERVDELKETLLDGATVLISYDAGDYLKQDLRNLSLTGLQTVILVSIILFITLGLREAIIAGISIPLSFLLSFIGLEATGNTLNFVSLFSLILAIGILVDSAIVVTEAIHTKLNEGKSKLDAALETIKEFHLPLLAGTSTTIAVFAPLFFLSGITGQFIKTIPFTIVFVLTASLFVALALVPLIGSGFLKAEKEGTSKLKDKQEELTHSFQEWYREKLRAILENRKTQSRLIWSLVGLFILTVVVFPATGIVSAIFFPEEDSDFIYVEIETAEGTVLENTDFVVREVEEVLYGHSEIESFVTTVGSGNEFGSGGSGSKLGNMTIILRDKRKMTSLEVVEDLRDQLKPIKGGFVRVSQPSSGPPVGAPIVIKVLGEDLDELERTITEVEALLNDIEGTVDVTPSTRNDSTQFVFTIDRDKAASLGISPIQIAGTLRTAVFGTKATTIESLGDDIDVVVTMDLNPDYRSPDETNETTVDALRQIEILTPRGTVLLGSLVDVSLAKSSAIINHEDRKRVATVSSQLGEGAILPKVLAEFEKRQEEIELPTGVELVIGGETEESDESFKEMGVAFAMGIILIIAILVLQFNSFRQALFIILGVPFALIGVFTGLALTGSPLSFPSLLGVIALSGIVVNNAIILIDVMNSLRKANGQSMQDVVVEGATSRLRPILLTTLTTVIGMVPLTYASAIWAPLAFAIMFGLLFATVITLILIPVFYYRWPGKIKD